MMSNGQQAHNSMSDSEEKSHDHAIAFHRLRDDAESAIEDRSQLHIDADTFTAAKEEHEKTKEVLTTLKTIAGNVQVKIRECERSLKLNTDKLNEFPIGDYSEERQQAVNALERVQDELRKAQDRLQSINLHIPKAEERVEKAKTTENEAANKFIQHYPHLLKAYTALYLSYLGVDLLFTAYTIKMAGDSFISFADAWGLPKPSDLAAFMISLIPAGLDTLFNMFMYDPRQMAIKTIHGHYKNYGYGIKPNSAIATDVLRDTLRGLSVTGVLLGGLNLTTILTHNLLGGAADLVGVEDWDFIQATPLALKVLLSIGIVAAANGYYGLSQDLKYYNGMQDGKAYRQLISSFRKLFTKDVPRAVDVIYRGLFSSSILRALSFYFLADKVRQMDPALSWVNPAVAFIIVTHHSICVRYGATYLAVFGAKEVELPKIFMQIKIKVERNKIIDQTVYESAEYLQAEAVNRNILNDTRLARNALTPAEIFNNARTRYVNSLSEKESDELDKVALIQVAKMLPVPPDAELPEEQKLAHARDRILAEARLESDLYLKRKTQSLKQVSNWQDTRKDVWNSSAIAVLRGLFGATIMSEYGMMVVRAIADNDTLSDNAFETVRVVSSIGVGFLAGAGYYLSVQQSALDEKARACFTKDNYSNQANQEPEEDVVSGTPQILVHRPRPVVADQYIAPPEKTNISGLIRFSELTAATIGIGSGTIRLIAGVYPTVYPLKGKVPDRVAVTSVTLTLAEQQTNGYSVFYGDIYNTVYGYLSSSKLFKRTDERREFQHENGLLGGAEQPEQKTCFSRILKRLGFLPESRGSNSNLRGQDIPLDQVEEKASLSNASSVWRRSVSNLYS